MPKLWNETIEAHRHAVSDAILETTVELVRTKGLPAITMSSIAAETGIGRATLYKYFKDVEGILVAWHQRQINAHLQELRQASGPTADAMVALDAALRAYSNIVRTHHGTSLAALLHALPHARHAHQHLHDHVVALIEKAVSAGQLRIDVPAAELARFALAALQSAEGGSDASTRRLVAVVIAGMRA